MPAVTAERLYLVRHGQTELSALLRYSGRRDIALTDAGRRQAGMAAESLRHAGIDAVYSSPLQRASDTARALAQATGAPLLVDPRLIEVDYGPLEGMDRDAARVRFGPPLQAWRDDPMGSPLPGVEPLADALARASEVTAEIVAGARCPAIVAHQGILRLVLASLGQIDPSQYFNIRFDEAQPVEITSPTPVS